MRYQGGCGQVMCPCAVPGEICGEWMGWKLTGFCPRCGWDLQAHAVQTVRALVWAGRACPLRPGRVAA